MWPSQKHVGSRQASGHSTLEATGEANEILSSSTRAFWRRGFSQKQSAVISNLDAPVEVAAARSTTGLPAYPSSECQLASHPRRRCHSEGAKAGDWATTKPLAASFRGSAARRGLPFGRKLATGKDVRGICAASVARCAIAGQGHIRGGAHNVPLRTLRRRSIMQPHAYDRPEAASHADTQPPAAHALRRKRLLAGRSTEQ